VLRGDPWRNRATCRDHPTLPASTWDDTVTNSYDQRETRQQRETRIEQAKAVCRRCPVQGDCLADVDLAYDEGVRGGIDLRDLRTAAARPRARRTSA
jgi:hypothetical protein